MKAYTLITHFISKGKRTYLFLVLFSLVTNAHAQVVIDTLARKDNGVWYTKNNVIPDVNPPIQGP